MTSTQAPVSTSPSDALYRTQAYEQRGRVAPIDGVLRVSSPHEWLVLLLLAATVASVLAWSVFGRLESGVSGPCALRASGVRHLVAAPSAGVVVHVLAEPGSTVEAGAVLARLSAPDLRLAAELARARATSLALQHPGAAETVAAVAEAEALAAIEQAGTAVLSPAAGLLDASRLQAGDFVDAGAALAEIVQADGAPPTVLVSLGDESRRVSAGMDAAVALKAAGAADAVISEARVVALGTPQPTLAALGPLEAAPAGADGTALPAAALGAETAAAELVAPPREFAAAAQSRSAYECTARIVTGSHRPIERLVGRR